MHAAMHGRSAPITCVQLWYKPTLSQAKNDRPAHRLMPHVPAGLSLIATRTLPFSPQPSPLKAPNPGAGWVLSALVAPHAGVHCPPATQTARLSRYVHCSPPSSECTQQQPASPRVSQDPELVHDVITYEHLRKQKYRRKPPLGPIPLGTIAKPRKASCTKICPHHCMVDST